MVAPTSGKEKCSMEYAVVVENDALGRRKASYASGG